MPLPAAPPAIAEERVTAAPEVPGPELERLEIDAARRAGDCRMVDDVTLMINVTHGQRQYVDSCHAQRQREIIPAAMARNDCDAVMRIPGMYPRAVAPREQRFVYHCWMAAGQMDLDSCIGMTEVGDKTSLPYIEAVLKRTERGLDTAAACMDAFQRITGHKM